MNGGGGGGNDDKIDNFKDKIDNTDENEVEEEEEGCSIRSRENI